jgi:endonuclease/exonuclease/phosphatase family metal-dependent hydrolase
VPALTAVTELRVASANLERGGLGDDGAARWEASMTALAEWDPHVVLLQEMSAREPWRLAAHLYRTANALGMTPVLGPPMPGAAGGHHPAILVAGGLRIIDSGPPELPGLFPAWCQATAEIPGIPYPVTFVSVHLPSRSALAQLAQGQHLASMLAQRGGAAVAGGDWNGLAPGGNLAGLENELPLHLRNARTLVIPGDNGYLLEPDYSVHHALAVTGLTDAAAALPPEHREPPVLASTGVLGRGRIDRFYLTPELTPALTGYVQRDTGGSDHLALMISLSLEAMGIATPGGPVP